MPAACQAIEWRGCWDWPEAIKNQSSNRSWFLKWRHVSCGTVVFCPQYLTVQCGSWISCSTSIDVFAGLRGERLNFHCQSLAVLFRSLFGPRVVEAFMVGVLSPSQCDAYSGLALCSEGCHCFPDGPSARLPHLGREMTAQISSFFVHVAD